MSILDINTLSNGFKELEIKEQRNKPRRGCLGLSLVVRGGRKFGIEVDTWTVEKDPKSY